MFGLINQKKLLKILDELHKNNCTEKVMEEREFYYCCGVANAINYICHKLKLDYHA